MSGTSTHRIVRRLLLSLSALAVLPAAVHGQGWIEPRPGIPPARWGVEKLRTTVTVRVVDRIATVEVEEWFRNKGGGLGEGDYVYPLPAEAVFTGYSLYQGDTELRGEMMDAGRARSIYEAIVRARQDPALIELVGKGMLRARVFPIEAGQDRRITLRYTQVLDRAGDALHFRYAAGGRHAMTRPGPIMPLPRMGPTPGGLTRSPLDREQRAALVQHETPGIPLTFTLIVEDGAAFHDPFSPTHGVDVERRGGRITVKPRTDLSGDFAVFLPRASRRVGITVATHNQPGADGYFMLTLSPGAATESRIPRDISVVVDVSGSMSGEKMEQARNAVGQLLGTLSASDRFRLIAFSSRVSPWRDGWTNADREGLRAARGWVESLRADGGTNIYAALETALGVESAEGRLPIVVFMTDGMATNGETRTDRIVAMTELQRGRSRIFAFGVGYDVNTHLLDALSEAARGTTQYVRPGESVEEPVSVLAARIRYPVLTDLAIAGGPVRLREVHPRQLPDLFAGEDLLLFGRYEGSGTGAITVTGRRNEAAERYAAEARFPARSDGNEYITRLWASRKLGDLDRSIRSARADGASRQQLNELIEELRQTALRYGLLSEYTAYLVQEPVVVAGGGRPSPGASPPFTYGWTALRTASDASAVSGEAAVARAEGARAARAVTTMAEVEAIQLGVSASSGVAAGVGKAGPGSRTVAGRTFRLEDGVWQDVQDAAGRRVISIVAYSRAYFDLVGALPEAALVLRELTPVQITGERVVIRVAETGTTSLSAAELARLVAEFRSAR
jgi:Ca-activated chloride channel homolog